MASCKIALSRECAELKAEIEASEQTISNLQATLEPVAHSVSSPSGSDALSQLAGRVEQLALQQSKIQALVERLASNERALESPEAKAKWLDKVIGAMDARVQEQQEKLDAAKVKVEQAALTLQVPDEVALMDADAGLNEPGLKKYWPYLEAKRDRDRLYRFNEILRMKVVMEKIDLQQEAPNGPAQ
jgi:predicted RNase H-like nuclease (RuvC/YqgF family)